MQHDITLCVENSDIIYLFASIMCLYKTIYAHDFTDKEVKEPSYIVSPRAPKICPGQILASSKIQPTTRMPMGGTN
jgi:hypothetical protein